ncbi:hypothetical protein DRE_06948 [Drechslerella stenobrocha 248]|uniref:Efficient mitochondria targeting-associated protein 19 n=1 Tax=Drechslerella stenobrocha 248 TaxID=1043628 RepID=W7HWC2_9PEZI|nr:hypothetical protein DRE_06948 [Drechslerella stenobrocha 248]
MGKPISQRPVDLFYRAVFSVILAIAIVADCSPLYPEWLRPALARKMHELQFATFKDPFFNFAIQRPWFDSLIGMELFVLVPLNAWLLYGWTVDHPLVPLNMLMHAYHMAVTTIPCLAEIYHDPSLSSSEIAALFGLYGPFVVLPVYMIFDAYGRISKQLLARQESEATAKAK